MKKRIILDHIRNASTMPSLDSFISIEKITNQQKIMHNSP